METQTDLISEFLDQLDSEEGAGLSVMDVLDYFAVMGVKLVRDPDGTASREYFAGHQKKGDDLAA